MLAQVRATREVTRPWAETRGAGQKVEMGVRTNGEGGRPQESPLRAQGLLALLRMEAEGARLGRQGRC